MRAIVPCGIVVLSRVWYCVVLCGIVPCVVLSPLVSICLLLAHSYNTHILAHLVSLLVIVCVNRATIVNVSHIVIAQCMPKGLYGDGLCAEMDYFKSGI